MTCASRSERSTVANPDSSGDALRRDRFHVTDARVAPPIFVLRGVPTGGEHDYRAPVGRSPVPSRDLLARPVSLAAPALAAPHRWPPATRPTRSRQHDGAPPAAPERPPTPSPPDERRFLVNGDLSKDLQALGSRHHRIEGCHRMSAGSRLFSLVLCSFTAGTRRAAAHSRPREIDDGHGRPHFGPGLFG